MRKGSSLGSAHVRRRFESWVNRNLADPSLLEEVDLWAELGDDLTFQEAVDLAIKKFPTLWKAAGELEEAKRVKKIVFIPRLVREVLAGSVQVTYRTGRKEGCYYLVTNRFDRQSPPKIMLEFYRSEVVTPQDLKDDDAKLAGLESAEELLRLLTRWYGDPLPKLYRNWFRVAA